MKNFDDFLRILTDEESKKEINLLIAESAQEEIREGNSIGVYLYDLIDAVTDYKLRKYHEWLFTQKTL